MANNFDLFFQRVLADEGTVGRATLDVASHLLDDISGSFNGSNVTFNLTQSAAAVTPRGTKNVVCSIGGVAQIAGSAFTVAGSQITFTSAPASGDSCALWAVST